MRVALAAMRELQLTRSPDDKRRLDLAGVGSPLLLLLALYRARLAAQSQMAGAAAGGVT
jgi:hypothetical protein